MTTKISQWQKIALLAAGISTSMVSVAWGGNVPLYELHSDGSIWQYTGTPCNGNVCNGWVELGAAPDVTQIAAGWGGHLYDFAAETDYPCQIGSYPNPGGWWLIGGNQCPASDLGYGQGYGSSGIAAGGGWLVSVWAGYGNLGFIYQTSPTENCGGEPCPWIQLDDNSETEYIYAGDTGTFQMHYDASIWEYTGPACTGAVGTSNAFCPGWKQLDGNPNSLEVAAGVTNVYQMWKNGYIWQYTGTPCNASGCNGWEQVGNNQNGKIGNIGITTQITAGGNLYQAQNNGSIWQYTGVPCSTTVNGTYCWGWTQIDNNPQMAYIVAGPTTVYEVHNTGSIWQYTGTPCNINTGVCSGWTMLDDNSLNVQVVYGF